MASFLPQGEGWLPSWLLLVCLSHSLPSKVSKLTTHSGLGCVSRQHDTSLHDHKKHARGLSSISLRNQRPLFKDLRYLDHRVCQHPSLRCLQHIQSPALPTRNWRLRYRMVPFYERVAAIQDGGVGQGSGRANTHFDRKFGLDVQPMELLCCAVAMESASSLVRVVSQSDDGTGLLLQKYHSSGCHFQGASLWLEELI